MFQGDFQSSTRRAATIVKDNSVAEISHVSALLKPPVLLKDNRESGLR